MLMKDRTEKQMIAAIENMVAIILIIIIFYVIIDLVDFILIFTDLKLNP